MWNWRHQVRIERLRRSDNLAIGTVFAKGQDLWYQRPYEKRGPKGMKKIAHDVVRDTAVEQLSTEHRELVEAMLNGYAAWARVEDRETGIVEAFPEEEFDLPLSPKGEIRIRGRLDLRFQPKGRTKVMAVMENKTRSSFRDDLLEMNLQGTIYMWALWQRSATEWPKVTELEGYWNRARKQMPGPRVTAPLFDRERFSRTVDELMQWQTDAIHAAWDMWDAAIYPNPMDSCSWSCDYKEPCMLRGAPELETILATEYKTKEERK
jgi:hypothetical protein